MWKGRSSFKANISNVFTFYRYSYRFIFMFHDHV